MKCVTVGLVLSAMLWANLASAQTIGTKPTPTEPAPIFGSARHSPLLGGVPTDDAVGPPIALTLADAVRRGLERNLGVLLEEQQVRAAEGRRWRQLSGLLPDAGAVMRESREKLNLAAMGFSGFPGIPSLIGPFGVFDARVMISQPVFDLSAIYDAREGAAALRAERHTYQDTRSLVVLVVSNLYLQILADSSRAEAAQVEWETADALYRLASDQNKAGVVPGIDVLRADVERQAARQRVIVAGNALAQRRSSLSRAIGLPAGQTFTVAGEIPYTPLPSFDVEQSITEAYGRREDLLSAQARVDAAMLARRAAGAEHLPSVGVAADYGQIGATPSTAEGTYAVAATVRLPIFSAGRTRARTLETDAELRQRRAEVEDLRRGISDDVRNAWRDLSAADQQVQVARNGVSLAAQALAQARDRFAAGVTNNIEVIQAQEAASAARENYISSLYTHNVARAALARALGYGENAFIQFIGG